MYPYLVHIERPDLTNWALPLVIDGVDRSFRYYNSYRVEIKGAIEDNNPTVMETWYCADEPSALALCKSFAQKCPGSNVNMYKLVGVAKTIPTPASFAKYSEKGLVPE